MLASTLAALLGSAACGSDTAAQPDALTTTPPPAVVAPDGGSIRMVEQGLSSIWDGAGKEMVTYGIVVENTSRDRAAVKTKVTIRITDGSGKAITDLDAGSPAVAREIGVVLPGQQVGIGGDVYVDRPGAASLLVEIAGATWLPPENELIPVARLGASEIRTQAASPGPGTTITFAVDSEYPDALQAPKAQAIFRDSLGQILGGTGPNRTAADNRYAPGRSQGQIRLPHGRPDKTDDSRTEVYLSPF
ncbi:hypothetical protein AB0J86_21040 [Micromonospora sp. NPDC049559]|uniref:hypothetical protein n=1 Tax=Micromonospora sp. NPDC049559 TaxID=3155923 RepID=UPI003447E122